MTQEEFVELMDQVTSVDWVEDCQFPYDCKSDCYCQRMRETDKTKQKVTIEDLKEWKVIFLERGDAK